MNYETLVEHQTGVNLLAASSHTVTMTFTYDIESIENFTFMNDNPTQALLRDVSISDNVLTIEMRSYSAGPVPVDFTFIVTIRGK